MAAQVQGRTFRQIADVWIRTIEVQAKLNGLLSPPKLQPGAEEPATKSVLTESEIAFRVKKLVEYARAERPADAKKERVQKAATPAAPPKTDRPRTPAPRGEEERIVRRRRRAMAARVQGESYRQIAEENGVSVSTAHEDVVAELAMVCASTRAKAKELRDILMERCDLALRSLVDQVLIGDVPAVRAWIRTVETQAKLSGLISLATMHVGNEDPTPTSGLTERELAFRVEALVKEAREERETDAKRKVHSIDTSARAQ